MDNVRKYLTMKRFIFAPILLSTLLVLFTVSSLKAQNRLDVLRYSDMQPGNGPLNLSLGGVGVSDALGFGSIVQNPATAAMFNKNLISINLGTRKVSEDANYYDQMNLTSGTQIDYLSKNNSFSDNQTGIASGGMSYKVPTLQGSFVIGASYNRIADFNQAYSVDAFNPNNTITDYFAQNSNYQNIGYESYALDTTATGSYIPVLREVPGGYQGINQHAQVTERGKMGEIALFGATEFQKNVYVGASLVFPVGKYSYHRLFLEQDLKNLYSTFPTDVQYINSSDNIDATIGGFYARFGFVYKVSPLVNIGASYQTRSRLTVKENYNSSITVKFKDSNNPEPTKSSPGSITYKVHSPGRLKVGVTLNSPAKLVTFHGQVEYVDYKQSRLTGFPSDYTQQQYDINQGILSDFKPVINYQAGVEAHFGNISPEVGFAYYPSPRRSFKIDKKYLSGGVTLKMNDMVALDLGVQYSFWNGQDQLYTVQYSDNTTDNLISTQKVHHLTAMAGFRVMF